MCIDFKDLNVACPKGSYLRSDIDHLIDGSLGYHVLSFMDAYSGYKQIKMDPLDALKTSFMSNHDNYYYYNAMPFVL